MACIVSIDLHLISQVHWLAGTKPKRTHVVVLRLNKCQSQFKIKFSINFILIDFQSDFQTARQVNNRLKEPRRLKKDTMAQTSINTFFTKQDRPSVDEAEPLARVKCERPSDDDESDAETVINSPPRIKKEPLDAYEMSSDSIIPKIEPEGNTSSFENGDDKMDVDAMLTTEFDSHAIVKIEPKPQEEITAAAVLRLLSPAESPSKEKTDVAIPPVVKSEPEEYPPSDEATDDEMDIDPVLAADSAIQVKTEPIVDGPKPPEETIESILELYVPPPPPPIEEYVTTAITPKCVEPAKRKPENQLKKDDGKKQRVERASEKSTFGEPGPSSRLNSRAVGGVNSERLREEKNEEVVTK